MVKQIYEHLITRKKYNTLKLRYLAKKEELEDKIVELNIERRIRKIEKEKFDSVLKEYITREVELKEEIKKLKRKTRVGRNDGK